MDHTSRMVRLLEAVRRERNGDAAASMRFYGTAYGLNYGVSLPALRSLARAQTPDHDFARYLYLQDIRELRLAALHIAQPEKVTAAEFAAWAAGIVNSEVAGEAAFALLPRIACFGELYRLWTNGENRLLQYAALMAASRTPGLADAFIDPALRVLRRNPDDRLTAQGVVALLAALAQKEEYRAAVSRAADTLGNLPAEDFVHEEIAWRLEFGS